MIPHNVQIALQQQKNQQLGLTQKDVEAIKEEGVKGWVEEEFGVKADSRAGESIYKGIVDASPELADLEKQGG